MSLQQTRLLEIADERSSGRLRLVLTIGFTPDEERQQLGAWSVSLQVVRLDGSPVGAPVRREELTPGETVCLDGDLPGGLQVSGTLWSRQGRREWLVGTGQLLYGFAGQRQQELVGGLAMFLPGTPAPPPPPPLPSPEPPPCGPSAMPIVEPARGGGDLFPYVYLRFWPQPSPEQLALQFIRYPFALDGPPSGQFLQELLRLRSGGAPDGREQMERLAAGYIGQRSGSDAPFVPVPEQLGTPFTLYPALEVLLGRRGQASPEALVADIFQLLERTPEQVRALLESEAYRTPLVRSWQSYFALVIALGDEPLLREALARLLLVDHLLRWLTAPEAPSPTHEALDMLARATPVLPAALFPLPPSGGPSPEPGPGVGGKIVPYAIGELRWVRQELLGHALGDLAHVESLMAGERRRSVRRRASRVVEGSARVLSHESAEVHEELVRTTSLQSELSRAVADTLSTTTYKDFSTAYGPPTVTLNGSWTEETRPGSGGPARSEATRFAKKVLEKASRRVAARVLEARSFSTLRESEQVESRVLDNSGNPRGRHGVYRWLDEVYRARVVSHGNRLVLELFIPTPAARYLARQADPLDAARPPIPPAALGIESFVDVTPERFPELTARYPGEALRPPPEPRRRVSGMLRSGEPLALALPEGYVAVEAWVGYVLPPGVPKLTLTGLVGHAPVTLEVSATGVEKLALRGDEALVQVLLQVSAPDGSPPVDLADARLSVELVAAPSPSTLDAWRLELFRALHQAYAARLGAFEGLGHEAHVPEVALRPRQGLRAVERRELQQGALDLFFQRARALTGSRLDLGYPRYHQFLERAFEWSELGYGFIRGERPSPVGPRPPQVPEASGGDARFLDFLEAAYARLLLPVTPSEAPAVLFFLASGMLWEEFPSRGAVHEADLALASELERLRPSGEVRLVGEPWELRVPTTITVLQEGNGSIEGLSLLTPSHLPEE